MRRHRRLQAAIEQRRGDGGLHDQHRARLDARRVLAQLEAWRERLDEPVPHRVLHRGARLGAGQLIVRAPTDRGKVDHDLPVVGQVRALEPPDEQIGPQRIGSQMCVGAQESVVDAAVGRCGRRAAPGDRHEQQRRGGESDHRTTSTGRSA